MLPRSRQLKGERTALWSIWLSEALKRAPQVILQILVIIASAEIFLHPKVEKNKEIVATHFPKLQFCDAVTAISPREGMTANE